MKDVTVINEPCVICPITKETQVLMKCHGCDAFKGFSRDSKTVKCAADEM